MAPKELHQTLKRAGQLNALAYMIIITLLSMMGVLLYSVIAGISVPSIWIMSDNVVRVLFFGFVMMVVLYMADQHRKVRSELLETHRRLEAAHEEIRGAYERLSFAQHTATLMSSLSTPDALDQVLGDSARHFGADAAAVVGDELTLYSGDGTDEEVAETAILNAAMSAVSAGAAIAPNGGHGTGHAIAVPLRIRGELKSVVCIWRASEEFTTDKLEGLALVARIIELAMENRLLLKEMESQLQGTLSVLGGLIDERVPENALHSTRVAEYVTATATEMGMAAQEIDDLRIAALIADVGLLSVPEYILRSPESLSEDELRELKMHPLYGARVAREAGLSETVESAIRDHHELLNGTGYPYNRTGNEVGDAARILAVCNAFDELTFAGPEGQPLTIRQALRTLNADAGQLYDGEVIKALAAALLANEGLRARSAKATELIREAIPA